MKDFSKMTKDEIIALLNEANANVTKAKEAAGGRKLQCLTILREGHTTVEAIAKRIGISARNVSSQLTYLRKDGVAIATDSLGRKFIESESKPEETEVPTETETPSKPETILRKKEA